MDIRKDLHHNVKPLVALNSQTIASSTTTVGNVLDTRDFKAVELFFMLGNWTDGTFTPLVEESDAADMSGSNAVADANLLGTEAGAMVNTDYAVSKLGVILGKRYLRVSMVSAGVTSGSLGVSVLAVLGAPGLAPVA